MDKTLGYILCTQSPGLFLAALMLLSLLVIEMDWRPLLGKRNGMK